MQKVRQQTRRTLLLDMQNLGVGMKKIAQRILAMAGAFSHGTLGVKAPTRAWKHDDKRLHKANKKRLRKNAARARNK